MGAGSEYESTVYGPAGQRDSRPLWATRRIPCADRPELLDLPVVDTDALRGNLADLARVNRLLGGSRLTERALTRLTAGCAPGATVRLIDVGTGAADIPAALLGWAARRGLLLQVVGVDRSLGILRLAQSMAPGVGLVAGDGYRLPLQDGAVDIAHCSLVLHHFDPPDAVSILAEMARVARLGVIVNDLVRTRLGLAGAWLFGHLATTNSLTRHDAPLSAQRAYTVTEMTDLLSAAGLRVTAIDRALGYRAAVTAVAT